MGIRSLMGLRGARDKPRNSYAGSALSFLFGRSTSGKPVNERTAMQTTAVYSCVWILAKGFRLTGYYSIMMCVPRTARHKSVRRACGRSLSGRIRTVVLVIMRMYLSMEKGLYSSWKVCLLTPIG